MTVPPQVYADPPKSIMIDGEEFDLDTSVDFTKFGKWYYVGSIGMSSGESWDFFYDPSTQNYAIGCLDGPDGFVLGKPRPPLA